MYVQWLRETDIRNVCIATEVYKYQKYMNMDKKQDNIILIGMPGAGKSTVGVVLAKMLGYRFLDSDLVIQEETGKLLCEILSEEGLDGFLAVENRINAAVTASRTVIATGGSVVYGEEAMEHLRSIGTVVYLKISYRDLTTRLGDLTNRGVALKPQQTLLELYDERVPLYEKYADITVEEIGEPVEQTARWIIEAKKYRDRRKNNA